MPRRELLLGLGALGLGAGCGRRESPGAAEVLPAPQASQRMPALFLAHGSPSLATDAAKGSDFRRWGEALPKPRAIVCVSAHWEERPIAVEVARQPKTIHDFGGFPDELYALRYPAPGHPELGARIARMLSDVGAVTRERGFDHGTWVPLLHLYPRADVPLIQVSLPRAGSPRDILELGRRLAPLRDEGVLIAGSGNLTHNLRLIDQGARTVPDWASEFDAWLVDAIARRDLDALVAFREKAPAANIAHPTSEHFTPLLVALGAAETDAPSYPIHGFEYGGLSRRSLQLG